MSTSSSDLGGEAVAAEVDAVLVEAFLNITARNPHSPTGLSLSGLGGCTRAGAYALAGTPASDMPPPREARAANMGGSIHDGVLPEMAAVSGGEHEVKVVLHAAGVDIPGRLDLRWPTVMVDLKTVGEHRLGWVRRTGRPYRRHLVQVAGYALAAIQAGYPITWIVIVYLDRGTGDSHTIAVRFTQALAIDVINRVGDLRRAAADPDNAPVDERGPGLSFTCNECAWLRRCWGPDARPQVVGPQRRLAADPIYLQKVLAAHTEATGAEGEARKTKEWTKAVLAGTEPGVYGPYKLRRDKDAVVIDTAACIALLEDRGIPIPMTTREGAVKVSLVDSPELDPTTGSPA